MTYFAQSYIIMMERKKSIAGEQKEKKLSTKAYKASTTERFAHQLQVDPKSVDSYTMLFEAAESQA